MPTNRSEIDGMNRVTVADDDAYKNRNRLDAFIREGGDTALVRGPIRVNNNVLTSLFRLFRVMPGTAVVVVGNGQVLEVLAEGTYHALSFPVMSRIDLYVVNVRERILDISADQEFTLFYQTPDKNEIPVLVDLGVAVSYQVSAPERVALYVEKPVTTLFDTVLESMRSIVGYTKYRDFQAGGQAGYMIAQQLQQRGVEASLGIRVINVQITNLRGAEEFDRAMQQAFLRPQSAQVDASVAAIKRRNELQLEMEQAVTERDIAKLLQLSPEYVLRFHPEMYAQLFGDRAQTDALRLQALTELAKSGMINMGALTGGDNRALQGAIQQMLTGAPSPAPAPLPPNTTAQLPAGRFPQANARDRLQAEAAALRGQGMHVMLKEEMGAYYAQITLHDSQNHTLALYFICTAQYPQQAPTMFLELDQVQQQYTPDALASWNAQRSLVDLVEAVVTAYS